MRALLVAKEILLIILQVTQKKQAAVEILELLAQPVSVSTQTTSEEAKESQTELNLDEVVTTFSLSAYDSDDDEAEFFPNTDSGSA